VLCKLNRSTAELELDEALAEAAVLGRDVGAKPEREYVDGVSISTSSAMKRVAYSVYLQKDTGLGLPIIDQKRRATPTTTW